jgi:NAD(P)-dependent dehydrogenase (short-subunit alcohol dehydrogenase family)
MKDKIILITGSTDGIGKQTALQLAKMGATVLVHGRDQSKAEAAQDKIKSVTNNSSISAYWADLASLRQIDDMVRKLHQEVPHLDILINNAGVYRSRRQISEDGYEMTFAVNHLAPFLLTLLMLDRLLKSPAGRIITVSSMIHGSHIDFKDLQLEKNYSGGSAYSLSKLCNILFTYALAERLIDSTITANCLHPGVINTKLLRAAFSGGAPVAEGAKNLEFLATSPELEQTSGKYFMNGRETKSADITYDRHIRERLWRESEKMVGQNFEDAFPISFKDEP